MSYEYVPAILIVAAIVAITWFLMSNAGPSGGTGGTGGVRRPNDNDAV